MSPANPLAQAHPGPWLDVVIHPQSGNVCWQDRFSPSFWPGEFEIGNDYPRPWPVPDLLGARLADCRRCGKTGIVPRDLAAAVRYIPGATLGADGHSIVLADCTAAVRMSQGHGTDEFTQDDWRQIRSILDDYMDERDAVTISKLLGKVARMIREG